MTQLEAVLEIVGEILGGTVIGAYPHGSVVLGELRPRSDLDVLVVTRVAPTAGQRRDLTRRLMEVSGRGRREPGDRPVELAIVVQDEVRPWRYPPRGEYLYGEWLRGDYERGVVPEPGPSPDLAPLIAMVLQGGRAYAGSPPAEVLDAPPASDIRRSIVEGIPGLVADLAGDEANVLLTFARIWTTLETGAIRSKDAAADWALARLPAEHRPVLKRARDVYLGTGEDRWDDAGAAVEAHVAWVLAEIRRVAGAGGAEPAR